MKPHLLLRTLASCLVLLPSCNDDIDVDNFGVKNSDSKEVRINAEALYSTHHTCNMLEAEDYALNTAKLLFDNNNGSGLKGATTEREVASTTVLTSSRNGLKSVRSAVPDTIAYIVSFANQKGFALVSADDRSLSRVLVCFENGEYNTEKIKEVPLMANILENAQQTIINDIDNFEQYRQSAINYFNSIGSIALKSTKVTLQTISNSMGPLLPTTWGQTKNYNRYCPQCEKPNCTRSSLVGCVNLCLGEILSYYKPESLVCYTGAEVTFDWASMLKTPTMGAILDDIPSTQKFRHFKENEGVQFLLGQIAYAERYHSTHYCIKHGETTYTIPDIADMCDGNEFFLSRNGFYLSITENPANRMYGIVSTSDLKENDRFSNKIIEHLKTKQRPIMAVGTGNMGHAWIVDGYKSIERNYRILTYQNNCIPVVNIVTDNYIHHNWGWDGMCNGYFEANLYNTAKASVYDNTKKNNHYEYDFYVPYFFDLHR